MKGRLTVALAALALSASAWGQGSFYEGKTVTVVIGASGGSLEIAARIVARHLGKHLPGNPNVIVQNMTGAAHLVATNHVYNVAKPDGLTLLAANPNVGIAQLTKVEAARFDLRRFQWLGSSGADRLSTAPTTAGEALIFASSARSRTASRGSVSSPVRSTSPTTEIIRGPTISSRR